MNLTILREFVVLANNLNYNLTAKQLFISQSTLSKHIQLLEKEVGVRLLIRDSHSVRTTQAGRAFATRVQKMLEDYNAALSEAISIDDALSMSIRVGYQMACLDDWIPKAYSMFMSENPDVKVVIYAMEIYEVIQAVCDGELDIGYMTLASNTQLDGIAYTMLKRDRAGIIVESTHRLASKESISIEDLRNEAILIPAESTFSRWSEKDEKHFFPSHSNIIGQMLKDSPYNLDIHDQMNGIGTIRPFLASTHGVAAALESTAPYFTDACRFVPFEDQGQQFFIAAIWKQSHESRKLLSFIECLEQIARTRDKGEDTRQAEISTAPVSI